MDKCVKPYFEDLWESTQMNSEYKVLMKEIDCIAVIFTLEETCRDLEPPLYGLDTGNGGLAVLGFIGEWLDFNHMSGFPFSIFEKLGFHELEGVRK